FDKCSLLAETLSENHESWKQARTNFIQTSLKMTQVFSAIRKTAEEVSKEQEKSEKAFVSRSRVGSFPKKRCYRCKSDQHLVAECPIPANVNSDLSVNNNNVRRYSCRVSSSNVLDSGSSSHHNNNRDRFDSLSPAGDATVSLADGSDVKIRGVGDINLQTDRG